MNWFITLILNFAQPQSCTAVTFDGTPNWSTTSTSICGKSIKGPYVKWSFDGQARTMTIVTDSIFKGSFQ